MTATSSSYRGAGSARLPQATRLMPNPYGGFEQVPAYVMAEPRRRGAISNWLRDQRAAAAKSQMEARHDR